MTVNNLFKFSAQESVLALLIENGTKVKMPSEIKPPLIFPSQEKTLFLLKREEQTKRDTV